MRLFFEHSVGAQELDDRLNAVAKSHADRRAERSAAEIFCFNAAFAESLFTYGKRIFRRFSGSRDFGITLPTFITPLRSVFFNTNSIKFRRNIKYPGDAFSIPGKLYSVIFLYAFGVMP